MDQVLNMMIKSVYSSDEMFLRELVSNASDACDKLRTLYMQLSSEKFALDPVASLSIQIIPDKEAKTLTIKDNGIGMTREDLNNYLGVIAKSGTKEFTEALKARQEGANAHLIGQFGIGFYSAYLVSSKVEVITKNPKGEALKWTSTGKDGYTIEEYKGEEFAHGTSLILHIKDKSVEFLESNRIIETVKKYSSFNLYPICTPVEKEVDVEEEKDESKVEESSEPKVEEVSEKKKRTVTVMERINVEKPLWERNIKEVPEEEMKSFYKTISGDWDDFLAMDFWQIEGIVTVKLLMFIPKRARFDMFNRNKKNNNIKMYCNNVFVTDELGDAIPEWMGFVSGAIISDDLPMNISRELIQGTSVMKMVKKTLPQKILEMIGKLSNDMDKYKTFYKEFGNSLKMAVGEANDSQRDDYAKCLIYYTTKSGDEMVTLDKYVERMHANQKQIYVLTGIGKEQVKSNPVLRSFEKYEVVYMYDVMDEVMLRGFKKYKGHSVQRITSEGVELPEEDNVPEEVVKSHEEFCKKVKDILSDKVEKVSVNTRIGADIPIVISTTKYSLSGAMENIMRSQPVTEANPLAAMTAVSKKIFEMNPNNGLIKKMKEQFESNDIESMSKLLEVLFDTALIHNGYMLQNPNEYSAKVYSFINETMNRHEKRDDAEVV
ncbi:heat shock protein 90 [Ordospora colligata]